jgi:hypothetical protein
MSNFFDQTLCFVLLEIKRGDLVSKKMLQQVRRKKVLLASIKEIQE